MKLTAALAAITILAAALAFATPGEPDQTQFRLTVVNVADLPDFPEREPGAPTPVVPPVVVVPAPPVYANPDRFQASALQWIMVATAIAGALATFATFVITKIGELKRTLQTQREELGGRLDRQKETTGKIASQVNAIALTTPGGKEALAALAPPNPTDDAPKPGTGLLALAIACFGALALMGCATNTGDAGRDARGRATNQALREAGGVLGRVAVSTLFNVASQELGGNRADFGSAAASGLWSQVNAADSGAAVKRIVDAYSGGRAPKTALAAKNAFDAVAQDERAPDTVNALATVLSTAAGAPPAVK